MAIQFNPNHTIASHVDAHHTEVEVFKDGEQDTDFTKPAGTSLAERIATTDLTVPDDCRLYRVKVDVLNTYMDCAELTGQETWQAPARHFFTAKGFPSGAFEFEIGFRLNYTYINSVSVICRFCTAAKEQTKREVAEETGLLSPLVDIVTEYVYTKSESHG